MQTLLDKLVQQLLNLLQASQQTYVELWLTSHRAKPTEIVLLVCVVILSASFSQQQQQ